MSFDVHYEVISVNEEARCMELIYTADGHPTQHISARLPYEGESLDDVAQMYSPVAYWRELQAVVVAPQVGATGMFNVLEPSDIVVPEQTQPTIQGAQEL